MLVGVAVAVVMDSPFLTRFFITSVMILPRFVMTFAVVIRRCFFKGESIGVGKGRECFHRIPECRSGHIEGVTFLQHENMMRNMRRVLDHVQAR